MAIAKGPVIGFIMSFAGGLRFPTLFLITGGLFLVDLVVPDMIPFGDEILLGLGTLMLASLKKGSGDKEDAPPEVPKA